MATRKSDLCCMGILMTTTVSLLMAGCAPPKPLAPASGPVRRNAPTAIAFVPATPGVTFAHQAHPTPERRLFETMGSGVAVLDYDNDGKPDLFFLNGASLSPGVASSSPALWRNLGAGKFADATVEAGLETPFYGMGCAVGDYDNDGDADLYCTAVLGPARLYRNELYPSGKARFTEVAAPAGVDNGGRWGTSAAWLDFDRDGWLDLFVCNYLRYQDLKDDLPCYSGNRVRTYCNPRQYEGEACRLYRNRGDGTFEDVSRSTGILAHIGKALGVVVWDFNGDSWPDICVASDTEPIFLFLNEEGKRFREVADLWGVATSHSGVPRGSMGIAVAPASQGEVMLAFTNFWAEGAALYRSQGGTQLADISSSSGLLSATRRSLGFGLKFLDADNDGALELLAINGHIQDNVAVFHPSATHAQRPMLFTIADDVAVPVSLSGAVGRPIVGRGLAIADLDADGLQDAVVTECNGSAQIWLNRSQQPGHWLEVLLEGSDSNRDGLGARVEVVIGSRTIYDYCRSGGSYLSASSRALHFGLGNADRISTVRVEWPSGTVDEWRGPAVDQRLRLREGSSPLEGNQSARARGH